MPILWILTLLYNSQFFWITPTFAINPLMSPKHISTFSPHDSSWNKCVLDLSCLSTLFYCGCFLYNNTRGTWINKHNQNDSIIWCKYSLHLPNSYLSLVKLSLKKHKYSCYSVSLQCSDNYIFLNLVTSHITFSLMYQWG